MNPRTLFASLSILFLLFIPSIVGLIQVVKAEYGTIYIRADGSIDPPAASISTVDNITYVFTADMNNNSIFVERSSITIDGRGHMLQGSYVNFSYGISLSNVTNVTVKNMTIEAFGYGIFVDSGSGNRICGSNITKNTDAIFFQSTTNNSIYENCITDNSGWGAVFFVSHNETLFRNNITGNHDGIWLAPSSNDEISKNNIANNTGDGIVLYGYYFQGVFNSSSKNNIADNEITNNGVDGIRLFSSPNNTISRNNLIQNQLAIEVNGSPHNRIYNNNFANNTQQALCNNSLTIWDDGYPSGGNYLEDYIGVDLYNGAFQNQTGSDGIGESQYLPAFQNVDHYPLMGMFSSYNVTYYTPAWIPQVCNVILISNSTISDFVAPIWLEHPEVIFLTFNASGTENSTGFSSVSFPTAMMNGTCHVFVNGTEIPYTLLPLSDANYSYLYFTYTHSTEEITIIPEFPSFFMLPSILIGTLLAVITCSSVRRKNRTTDHGSMSASE
jgi:parallel beta-helix repeat protein